MKLTRNISLLLIPIIVAIAVAGFYLLSRPVNTDGVTVQAPDFKLTLLSGKKISLSDYRGRKPVVINFWASWCPPCRDEAPVLAKVAKKYKGKVQFLGIIYQDSAANAGAFIKEFGIPYPNGIDQSGISSDYKITGVPETFFVAKDGILQSHWIGAISEETLTGYIDELL